ncbi:ParA family protein [Bacillus sp. Marseille-P3661]|uniref:ParA family protein n=1 Tax=Bacillus sp. Marseille-P3661 TaxID=1936234 RepID=UPI000C8354DF|nr:AAA family ATPase [Bacillus sp. Marseille-P3661]
MTAKKIFVGNYKGGVGKTTSIYQIALHMADEGKRVLLVDLDPQCSLSEICLGRMERYLDNLPDNECLNFVYDVWNQSKKFSNISFKLKPASLIKQTEEKINFIPSNIFYSNGGLDKLAMSLKNEFEDLFVLQQFFQTTNLDQRYDYILFDCPPSNNIITQGAFLLSDFYIIPSIFQTISIRGVIHYIKTVEEIYKQICEEHPNAALSQLLFGEKPQLIGIFETLKKGSTNNKNVHDELKEHFKDIDITPLLSLTSEKEKLVFQTIIFNYEDTARATANGKRVAGYADLTFEILECLENRSQIQVKFNLDRKGWRWNDSAHV